MGPGGSDLLRRFVEKWVRFQSALTSWKAQHVEPGCLTPITPYHGWSKGIYYNNRDDALSERDQAVVIADIDPYNMLEGKPRAQTMPVPLQLVAYLPLIECVNSRQTEETVFSSNGMTPEAGAHSSGFTKPTCDEATFWSSVQTAMTTPTAANFEKIWEHFPDTNTASLRAAAFWRNGAIQPSAGSHAQNAFGAPALYDWIDVDLSLSGTDTLNQIGVPSWVSEKR